MGEPVQIPHDSSANRVNWKRIAIFVAIQCGQTFKQSIYWLRMRRLPAVEKIANVTMDSRAKSIETGRLTTGQLWAVVKSKANSLPQRLF